MSFFRGDFGTMTVQEIPTPPKQEKRLTTK
jgi:hypothetical protein